MSRLAYVGTDRRIHLSGARGEDDVCLTAPLPVPGPWASLGQGQELWSWPTWSPDGRWIAAFCTESSDEKAGPVRVVALSLDGVHQEEWCSIEEGSPIYLQWHPQQRAIALLLQVEEELELRVVDAGRLGAMPEVEAGVPLFFSWDPTGKGMLIHAGDRKQRSSRLILRDPLGSGEDQLHERAPGNFCAPLFTGGTAIYVLRDGEDSVLTAGPAEGGGGTEIGRRLGLIGVTVAPTGAARVAWSSAPKGEGSPYQGVELYDLETGRQRQLTDAPCLAWFWSPTGDFLVYIVVDSKNNCLTWYRVDCAGGGAGAHRALLAHPRHA
ncbi:MAG TPA: hypothetical protein PKW90_15195, partial [Myxococcota bacterium]|nr:hypothetical protein [Myxococcota bacterium]